MRFKARTRSLGPKGRSSRPGSGPCYNLLRAGPCWVKTGPYGATSPGLLTDCDRASMSGFQGGWKISPVSRHWSSACSSTQRRVWVPEAISGLRNLYHGLRPRLRTRLDDGRPLDNPLFRWVSDTSLIHPGYWDKVQKWYRLLEGRATDIPVQARPEAIRLHSKQVGVRLA